MIVLPKLPPPKTFPEGQRSLALKLASAAGVFCGAFAVGLVLILWLGGWSDDTQSQRITVFAITMVGILSGMMAVIVGLLIGGPVGRLKASAGREGASLEAEGDEQAPCPHTGVQGAPEAAPGEGEAQ